MAVKKGFKNSVVGTIPLDWDVRSLLSIAKIANGQVDPRIEPYKSMVLVAPDHIESGTGRLVEKRTAAEQRAISGKYLFTAGDVVYSKIRPYLRKAVLADFNGICSADMYPLKPVDAVGGFILPVILGHRFTKYAESVSVRSGMPKINRAELADFIVAIPPVREQHAIAKALSDADALIESLEQLLVKKRQIKQAAMHDLLTGKKRLPGFSDKWEVKRFDQLFSNLRNASNSRSELSPHGEVAYVHYGDIHIHPMAFLNPVELQTFIPRAKVRAIPRLLDGDLLMADASEDTTAIGKAVEITGLNGADAVAGLHTMALRANKEFLADGFKGFIQYMPKVRNALVSLATGVSVYGITKSGVKAIEVTIPRPDEQTAISSILTDMDKEIMLFETKLSKAQKVKQGMMQELLTGRIRLV